MVLGAIIGGVLGIGTSVVQGQQQAKAAKEANKLAEERAKDQYERAKKEWKIDYDTRLANWAWEYAQHEAQIFQEKQAKSDYEWRQGRLIDAALQNLEVNQSALFDRYIVEEGLRAEQDSLALANTMDTLSANAGESMRQGSIQLAQNDARLGQAMSTLALDSSEALRQTGITMAQNNARLDQQMIELSTSSNEAVRQYMQQIRQAGLESQRLTSQTGRESQELMSSLTLSMQEQYLERDLRNIAAVIDGNAVRARSVARQGGSNSSQRIAKNKAQELGRTYGLLMLQNRDRDSRVALFNQSIKGERAKQMGQLALSIQDNVDRIKYTSSKYVADSMATLRDFAITRQDTKGRQAFINSKYANDSNAALQDYAITGENTLGRMSFEAGGYNRDAIYNMTTFDRLTIPSYDLAARQGDREMKALQIQTQSTIDEASMPFRESIFFAPRQPIAGLAPEYNAPTKIYEPSGFDLAFNAISAGVQGAMNFSYQKPGGGLGFY